MELFNQVKQIQGMLTPIKQRLKVLAELKALLKKHQVAIIEAISKDFRHRATEETLLTEFFPLNQEIKFIRKHLKSWTKPRKQRTNFWFWPSRTRTQLQALGTVGIIAPWNYPLFLSMSPLVAAIAAGNSCLVKMSEYTPHTAALLQKIIGDNLSHYGLAIVTGDAKVAETFSQLPFDHLLFTGAASIGKKVMAAASQNLTPVTLELGGKSPAIIDDKINMKEAVTAIMRGKLMNAGQICVAPDYVMLPVKRVKEFVQAAITISAKLYPTWTDNLDYTCIINDAHWLRLKKLLDDAVAKGAEWLPLGEVMSSDDHLKFQPGLLLNVNENMLIMQEEIFGPILPIKTVEHIDEAITYIAEHEHPLAIYAYTRDKKIQKKILAQTLSGGLCFNECLVQIVQNKLPFGGVGQSGQGQYRGRFGVETFSKLKPIYYHGRIHCSKLLSPPYGIIAKWFAKLMV